MVWRKADNWTAFTSGSITWVNGPYGVEERRNEERFEWELTPGEPVQTPTPAATPEAVRSPLSWEPGPMPRRNVLRSVSSTVHGRTK